MGRRDISKVKVDKDSFMVLTAVRKEVKMLVFTRFSVLKKGAVIDPFFLLLSEISSVEDDFLRMFFQIYSDTDMSPAG